MDDAVFTTHPWYTTDAEIGTFQTVRVSIEPAMVDRCQQQLVLLFDLGGGRDGRQSNNSMEHTLLAVGNDREHDCDTSHQQLGFVR